MRTRFFRLWAVLALAFCFLAGRLQSASATTAESKGIDSALLAKAEAGNAEAQRQLGNIYAFGGHHVRRNYAQAEFWYRKGAEQGDPGSEFQLGGLYHFGQGVPQDSVQAFAWTVKAAKQGDEDAEFFISTCYSEGWGVAKDDAQSMVWLRKAAEKGHTTSQYMLGWAYAVGDVGVTQDYTEAYFWLDLAASGEATRRKRTEAVKRRDGAASHLTQAELSRVQERVQQWIVDHPAESQ